MWMILARRSGTGPGTPGTRQQLVTLLFRLPAAAVSVGYGSAA